LTVTQKQIDSNELIAMDIYADGSDHSVPLAIDLVYSDAAHPENIFETALYRQDARLYLYRPFADIVLRAAALIHERDGSVLVLKDGLRPVEAQQAMQETPIVRANPQWSADGPDRLLSPPGKGGHPRGMAVDVTIAHPDGMEWDMGTPFDYLTTDPALNPAARDYRDLAPDILANRATLEGAFLQAAAQCGYEILPLPSEWWDFRFPSRVSEQYAPIHNADLPPDMRMIKA